ncbi:hypothetical protein BJ166DRAFT_218410 [Pestalotiopsis sp. NC0098]|nr:hypothetical protein BJ166DRAFT_218410 [Pestalotiopsis sp. NC0098]
MAAAVNPQLLPISKLTCGFCGFVSPHFSADPNNVWSPYYRAVYAVGPLDSHEPPRLSGVGFHRHDREDNYVPARADQRWDDHDDDDFVSGGDQQQQQQQPGPAPLLRPPPPELVRIRDIKAPGPEVPAHEQLDYAWGFLFHEACWSVLEQAVKPREVDIPTIWRILCSVPCGSELPNWGHNYGGLYMGTMRDQARGEHFVLLGRNSNLVIPSTFSNPFRVPDLEKLVLQNRIVTPSADAGGNGGGDMAMGEPGREVSGVGRPGSRDPFAALPLELKEMLLCYMGSASAAAARLASRALASTPLAQPFFQSRFWPGREMGAFFDGFLLPAADVRGTDWRRLYWQHKVRLKYNRVCLGERNRLRLWTSTIWPLAEAMDRVRAASELRGGPDWRWTGGGGGDLEADWTICRTAKLQAPMVFGEIRRVVHRAEVQFPAGARVAGVRVSFIDFFGSRYVTGLRFMFDGDTDDDGVELGYVMRSSEEYLPVPSGCLAGFHCATDECGFRALALAEGKGVVSEYLNWAGRPEALTVMALKTAAKDGLKRVRASFDGFRLQALLIPER